FYEEAEYQLTCFDQNNLLPALKEQFEWLKTAPSQTLQQVLKDLDQAYKNFFRRATKGGEAPGFPKFKKKGVNDSFRLPQGFSLAGEGRVKLPKVGMVKFIQSQEIQGRIRNITIRKDGKHWYIAFNCEVNMNVPVNQGSQIGVDCGIAQTVTTSEAVFHNLPKETLQYWQERLKKAQRQLARKTKKSKNWIKCKQEITRIFKKIRDIRHDMLHKISTEIAQNHSYVVLEDLKTANMTKSAKGDLENPGKCVKAKSGLNREILNSGWHTFKVMLGYKCEWYGSFLELVDPKHTSQTCHECECVSKNNRKSQSVFVCESCGHTDNADVNAAKNIRTRGLRGRASGAAALAG
ncbi:MAG: transposase, partial [Fibrobacteria bacterium]|nr:transposase [Fibrobacteria bacterium]